MSEDQTDEASARVMADGLPDGHRQDPPGAERTSSGERPMVGPGPPVEEPPAAGTVRPRGPGTPVLGGLLVALIVLVAGFGFTVSRPTTYSVTAVASLAPRDAGSVSAATVELVARSYMAYLTSPYVLARAGADSGVPADELTRGTSVTVEPSTANLQVAVQLPGPAQASAAANAMGNAAVEKATTDPLVRADLVSPADPGVVDKHPPRSLLLVGSVLAALLAGAVATVVLAQRARREPDADGADGSGVGQARAVASDRNQA